MATTKTKTPEIFEFDGKNIPLTKKNFPNLVYLPKEIRAEAKKIREEKDKEKQKILIKEFKEKLEKLGK